MSTNPYSQQSQPTVAVPMKRSKAPLVIAGFIGAAVIGSILCCGGGYGLTIFFKNVMAEGIRAQLRDHPILQEHIGEIENIELDLTKSIATSDDETFVYSVDGSKADGELTVKSITTTADSEEIISASLRLKDGQTFELDL